MNEFDFSVAEPGFQLLLSSDCVVDVGELFEVDEAIDAVFGGVAVVFFVFVFLNRRIRLFVTPMYRVFNRLASMYTKYMCSWRMADFRCRSKGKDKNKSRSFASL